MVRAPVCYTLWHRFEPQQCLKNGSAGMLAIKRLADVAPEVNLENPLYTGEVGGIITALKPKSCVTRSSKKNSSPAKKVFKKGK